MKRFVQTVLSLLLAAMLLLPALSVSAEETVSGKITLWGWEDSAFAEAIKRFNEQYPGVEVVYTPVSSSEYVQKIQTAIVSGTELPDVACLEIDSRGKLFTFDVWENLENGEYDFNRDAVVDYLVPLMTNQKGEIVCVDWQLCPSGIAYKRDLAKQYLGTDDPDQLAALLPDWNAFIEQGRKVRDESNGEVKMFAGLGDVNRIIFNQITDPIVADGKINVTNTFANLFSVQTAMRDEGISGNISIWSTAWSASFAGKSNIFYPCATWIPYFLIQANDPDGKGNWGIMSAPGGAYSWGGTAFAITKSSQNKQAAWAFIKWMLFSEEGISFNETVTQYPSPAKVAYEKEGYMSASNEYFGQDLSKVFFDEFLKQMKVRPLSEYDVSLWDIVGLVTNEIMSTDITADKALEMARTEVQNKMPELQIVG